MTAVTRRDRLGTAAWVQQGGGRLQPRERIQLLVPLLQSHLRNIIGRAALVLGVHPGRDRSFGGLSLTPPTTGLTRDAAELARDTLAGTILQHSHRCYAWGAALASIEGVAFDPEVLFVAAMLHDTGLPTPTLGVDFTASSVALAQRFGTEHRVPGATIETVSDAIALHHSPGVTIAAGPEAYLLSAGAALDVFGLRRWDLSTPLVDDVVSRWPRDGFKRQFARLWREETRRVPGGRAQLLRRYAVSDLSILLAPFRD